MLAPWMIKELERENERLREQQRRPIVRVPLERPEMPREEAEQSDCDRGVHILDISPLPENVTVL